MNKEGRLYKTITFIDEYSLEMGSITVNGLGYAIIGILYEIDKNFFGDKIHSQTIGLVLLIIVFILNIFLGVRLINKKKSKQVIIDENIHLGQKIQALENTIDDIRKNSLEIFNEHLAALYYRLGLTENERISFYKFQDERFHLVGRYSINPFLNERNRKYYPSNEGLIGLAWQAGEYHINNDIPEFINGNRQSYYSKIKSLNEIPTDTLKAIKMKSRSFYLKAFTDSRNLKRNSIIVIESTETERLPLDKMRAVINEEETKFVSFIERLKWDMPALENANIQGF